MISKLLKDLLKSWPKIALLSLTYEAVNFVAQTLGEEVADEDNKIVGGTAALVEEFPYQVSKVVGNE